MIDERIVDMYGHPIVNGSRVRVHQDEQISTATVMDISDPTPTMKFPNHHWVDIEKDDKQGLEGMMTYILEVIEDETI